MNNTWMTDPQYLAQVGHFFSAYSIIVTVAWFSHSWTAVLVTLAVGLSVAAIKEFWYDLKYESPKQTLFDSSEDFGFYTLGALVGMLVLLFAK